MITWLSALAAIVPMILYLTFLRNMDRFEREPLKLVLKHFFWGATGAVFFAVLGSEFLSLPINAIFSEVSFRSLLMTVIIAPLVEETTKGIYLFKTSKNFEFDNITDGLVYGGAIGLGFGMTENFMYFLGTADNISAWAAAVVIRITFTAVMHSVATGTFGAFIALRKFSKDRFRNLFPIIGIALAIFFHFMWNLSVSFSFTPILGFIFLFVIVLAFFAVFKLSLNKEKIVIEEELRDEDFPALFKNELLEIIHNRKKRIDQSVYKEYISNMIKLAFRKRQLTTARLKDHQIYLEQILIIRKELAKEEDLIIMDKNVR